MKLAPWCLLCTAVPYTTALDILLTSQDSWVSAGLRSLYTHLTEVENHNVLLVAPLHQQINAGPLVQLRPPVDLASLSVADKEAELLRRTGDFEHYLSAKPQKRAKGLVESSHQLSQQTGCDLDPMVHFVDGTPLAAALVGLDYLIPYLFPDFSVDLILAGPNEGHIIDREQHSGSYAVCELARERNIPSMVISGGLIGHHYYKADLPQSVREAHAAANTLVSTLVSRFTTHSLTGPFGPKNFDVLKTVYADPDGDVYNSNLSKFQEVLSKQKLAGSSYPLDEEAPVDLTNRFRLLPDHTALSVNLPDTGNDPTFYQTTGFPRVGRSPTASSVGRGSELVLLIDELVEVSPKECWERVSLQVRCDLPGEREVVEWGGVSIKAVGEAQAFWDFRDLLG